MELQKRKMSEPNWNIDVGCDRVVFFSTNWQSWCKEGHTAIADSREGAKHIGIWRMDFFLDLGLLDVGKVFHNKMHSLFTILGHILRLYLIDLFPYWMTLLLKTHHLSLSHYLGFYSWIACLMWAKSWQKSRVVQNSEGFPKPIWLISPFVKRLLKVAAMDLLLGSCD